MENNNTRWDRTEGSSMREGGPGLEGDRTSRDRKERNKTVR